MFPIFCTRFKALIITQHTDSLLTFTNAHGMTRDIKMLRFHATTAQNSHHAFPTSPHSHKSQPRKFFHHKLYTLPESTSMIPIKCSQNTRDFQCCLVFLSLEFLYSSLANCQVQQKILAFSQALLPPTEQPLTSSPSSVVQNSFTDLRYSSKPTLPIRATPSLIIRHRQSASTPIQ